MTDWLENARDRLVEATGIDRAALDLDDEKVEQLLELAGVAAHDSGQRTNAPLVCYLVGVAQGRSGAALDDLAEAVVGSSRR